MPGGSAVNKATSLARPKSGKLQKGTPPTLRVERKQSKLTIGDVSTEDLRLVSETSFECIDCVHSLIAKANSIHAPYDLRDLSLTLAVLERQLYNYVNDHILRKPKNVSRRHELGSPRSRLRTLRSALRHAHEMLDDGHIPLICGGVASLLHNLKGALNDTKECVNSLSHFFFASPQDMLYASLGVMGASYSFWTITSWLNVTLNVLSTNRRVRWDGPMRAPVGIQLNVLQRGRLATLVWAWRRLYDLLRTLTWRSKVPLSLVVGAWVVHRVMRYRSMEKLRQCHRQLLLLQRIMKCVTFALGEARMRRAKSYIELVAYPSQSLDQNKASQPAARLLLESVAYPCNPYLHQYTKGRHYILKLALDIFYSSFGIGWRTSGGRWWLALIFTNIAIPFFITHPERASSYATGIRQHMSPQFFRFICWTGNNKLTRWLALLCMRNLKTRRELKVNGVRTYIFNKAPTVSPTIDSSATPVGLFPWEWLRTSKPKQPTSPSLPHPLNRPSSRPYPQVSSSVPFGPGPVVLYVHGGGFCSSLLTMDLPFVNMLANKIKIPVVIAEYSLAPENPYPTALEEVCRTYEWIRTGGLGYIPSSVVLVGESAGGNLVCALCVRYAMQNTQRRQKMRRLGDWGEEAKGEQIQLLKLPDAVVLGYPALNLGASPSPSRALHMCDPVLPIAASNLATAYLPKSRNGDAVVDPQISPIYATDEQMVQFPPMSIMTGGMDILLDDAVDFHVRLRRNGVPGDFHIFRTLPHGFLSMGDMLPEAYEAQKLAIRWIQGILRQLANKGRKAITKEGG